MPSAPRTVTDKRCFITGAASGIGRATAIATAARGGRVLLTDINAAGLEETAAQITASGGTVDYVKAVDISDHAAVVAMAAEIHDAHGSMDVVMNVAGISIWGAVENLEHEHWQRLVDINLMGPIHVIECFVPPMVEARRGGHLVNVSSAAGLFGLPWHAAYSATKFGLRGISEVLRFDLRRHGIDVHLVCPGGVDTPLVGTVEIAGVDKDDPKMRKMVQRFQAHAESPDSVAGSILEGLEKGRYMVFTSRDIQVGYFFQRKFALPYELVMRVMNDQLTKVAGYGRR
ncbi:putative oxidoreductase EphD [Paraconexibacter sp. AEG42_29]|uniref:Oxidoreductase EphD n=1 Tax=Paraconexibacter sp. AEG42_29 TaxID=2997339 RepID=A0AAU7AYF7_9ACTN